MTTFIFIHGMWHGGWCWEKLSALLKAAGHDVHALMFARNGYGVMMIDLRVHGESGGDLLTFGGDEYLDVSAAVDYLQARPDLDPERIGVMGLSLGASAFILAGARDSRLAVVVADAPGATVFKDWAQPETFYDSLYVPFDHMFFFYLHRIDGVSDPLPSPTLWRKSPRARSCSSAG